MRRPAMRMAFLVIVAGCCLGRPALAQNREKAWELNPWVGYTSFGKKLNLDSTLSYGLRFGYHWTRHHMVEFGFAGASTKDTATGNLSADLLAAQVNYIYNFFLQHRDKVVAFATAGAGVVSFSTFGFVSNPDLIGDENDSSLNLGGGLRFFGGRRVGFRLDAREIHFTQRRTKQSQDYTEIGAGLTIVLGGA